MALSMDEQRMLAEIERRLAAEDPRLAVHLSAFRRPSRISVFHSARARIIGSLFTVAVVAMVSLMVYAILPFRSGSRTTGHPVTTTVSSTGPGQPKIGAGPGTKTAKNAGKNSGKNSGKNTAATAANGGTVQHSPGSHASGAAVHQADGPAGTTAHPASTAGQGP
jgi:Protein of unknown function (DUF3040)